MKMTSPSLARITRNRVIFAQWTAPPFLSAVLCMMCMCLIAQARVHLTHVHIHVYLFARGVQCRGHLVITLAPCAYRGISRVFRVQLLQFAVTERTQLFSRTWQSH